MGRKTRSSCTCRAGTINIIYEIQLEQGSCRQTKQNVDTLQKPRVQSVISTFGRRSNDFVVDNDVAAAANAFSQPNGRHP